MNARETIWSQVMRGRREEARSRHRMDRAGLRERFSIEPLVAEVGKGPLSLHEHFRAVTVIPPLQFQKQLRVQDVRSLMLVQDIDTRLHSSA